MLNNNYFKSLIENISEGDILNIRDNKKLYVVLDKGTHKTKVLFTDNFIEYKAETIRSIYTLSRTSYIFTKLLKKRLKTCEVCLHKVNDARQLNGKIVCDTCFCKFNCGAIEIKDERKIK